MSNIYIQEPPTHGKVLLETTVGDIEIELWSKECPKACRNFVQLCMEGYYNKTKFHRVVKEFIVQGGDPTGTGHGGDSIYGCNFKDEIHSRLRFVRRGLVAMANTCGEKDSNASQFFFTMASTPDLMNKHTIFGKVAGDTIYNMMKLQEGIVDEEERPKYPHKILRSKVLNNPFPDIVPRVAIQMITDEDKKPKSKMKATKDFKLLSFGDEAEEEDETLKEALESAPKTGKSSHDLLNDPKLLKEAGYKPKNSDDEESDEERDVKDLIKDETINAESVRDKLKSKPKPIEEKEVDIYGDDDELEFKKQKRRRDEIKREIKALKREMRGETEENIEDKEKKDKKNKLKELTEEEKNNDLLLKFHQEREKFAEKTKLPKKTSSAREEMTMKLLEKFKQKLQNVREEDEAKEEKEEEEDTEEEVINSDKWLKHSLKFKEEDPVLAKDASTKDDDWFDIFDPRNPINKRRRGEDTGKNKRFKK